MAALHMFMPGSSMLPEFGHPGSDIMSWMLEYPSFEMEKMRESSIWSNEFLYI